MRLLFIHGIGQEGSTEAQLLAKWKKILVDHGFDRALLEASAPEMAYYGDLLDALSDAPAAAQPMTTSAVEIGAASADERAFLTEALTEIGETRGITPAQAEAAAQRAEAELGAPMVAPMSTAIGRFGVGVLRLLEGASPTLGEMSLRVLKQAYAYLCRPGVMGKIDDRVRPRFGTGRLVVVSHSLGTIIAFRLLRQFAKDGADVEAPLLVTLGSPLAQTAVRNEVRLPYRQPANVARWENFYDRGDPVTLGKPLAPFYDGGIDDHGDVNNRTFNAHSIEGYLDQPGVHDVLAAALLA